MKIDIKINKTRELSRKCLFCEREVCYEYYRLDIDFEDHTGNYGRYRNLCNDCHCSLKKHFTGVD